MNNVSATSDEDKSFDIENPVDKITLALCMLRARFFTVYSKHKAACPLLWVSSLRTLVHNTLLVPFVLVGALRFEIVN